jgi:hypothetical protein
MLQIVTHAYNCGAKDIDNEGTKGERSNLGIQVDGGVETGKTSQGCENEREDGTTPPRFCA